MSLIGAGIFIRIDLGANKGTIEKLAELLLYAKRPISKTQLMQRLSMNHTTIEKYTKFAMDKGLLCSPRIRRLQTTFKGYKFLGYYYDLVGLCNYSS